MSVSKPVATLHLKATSGWVSLGLPELWSNRELLYFLTWRELKVRYKQTALGAAWAIIQPVFTMVVFSLFFGKLAKIPSNGLPYPIFAYAALVPWSLFAHGLNQASNSLVGSSNLIRKVYFPRLTIPISTVLAGVVDFLLAFLVLIAMMVYYRIPLTGNVVWLPAFFLLAVVTSLGVGLWLSALNVEFRDVRYIVPFITQVWLFATPIAYPTTLVPEAWRVVYGLNPMVGVVVGFRWSLLNAGPGPSDVLLPSAIMAILLLIGGAYYFRRMEKNFADII